MGVSPLITLILLIFNLILRDKRKKSKKVKKRKEEKRREEKRREKKRKEKKCANKNVSVHIDVGHLVIFQGTKTSRNTERKEKKEFLSI